jgi:PKD repeat protein
VSDEAPTAAFGASPATAVAGSPVTFDATASNDPDGTITNYSWNFGDSSPAANGATPSHTYAKAGTYTATLTITDSDSQTATISHPVTVAPAQAPTAAFTAPSVREGTALSFDGSASSDPNPGGSITGYAWDFGDGTTGSGVKPTHTYAKHGSYTATLTITNAAGLTNSVSHAVTVTDEAPTASFAAPSGLAKKPLTFVGTGSDPDGTITAYSWSFGDGSPTATGAKPSHTFAKAGTYNVKLTVTDSDGQKATVAHLVKIAVSCVVPKLVGKTLAQAKSALVAANCSLGTVPKPPPKPTSSPGLNKHWALLVGSQSPAAGQVRPKGTRVSVKLVWRAVKN